MRFRRILVLALVFLVWDSPRAGAQETRQETLVVWDLRAWLPPEGSSLSLWAEVSFPWSGWVEVPFPPLVWANSEPLVEP